MGFYASKILPFIMDKATNTPELAGYRKRMLQPARGRVLEIGFGTGLNAPHFGSAVEKVVAIDPHFSADKRALKRIEEAPIPIELRVGSGEKLDVEDADFEPVPPTLTGPGRELVTAIFKLDDSLLLILDTERLLEIRDTTDQRTDQRIDHGGVLQA